MGISNVKYREEKIIEREQISPSPMLSSLTYYPSIDLSTYFDIIIMEKENKSPQ
jgi:hypothetical protein